MYSKDKLALTMSVIMLIVVIVLFIYFWPEKQKKYIPVIEVEPIELYSIDDRVIINKDAYDVWGNLKLDGIVYD
ncbi:MAG: hypothetical protein IKA83_05990 [Paludibacteraceae bacterium]|nr:hypothetical protein [Paludibacteraceae bacterium]